ncbi:MAG: type VI secretion system contractile sheath domain-containing protein [Gemmobacter sp.]
MAVPEAAPAPDLAADALDALRAVAPVAAAFQDDASAALDALRTVVAEAAPTPDPAAEALAALREAIPVAATPEDDASAALDALRMVVPEAAPAPDPAADALAALRDVALISEVEMGGTTAALDALLSAVPEAGTVADATADALAALRAAVPAVAAALEDTGAVLEALRSGIPEHEGPTENPLAGLVNLLASPEPDPAGDPLADLDALLAPAPAEPDPPAGLAAPAAPTADDPLADLDALLSTAPAVPDPLAGLATPASPPPDDPLADLDALLAPAPAAPDPVAGRAASSVPPAGDPLADLDALLSPAPAVPDPLAGLAAPASPPADDPLADLDALLAPAPAALSDLTPVAADDPLAGIEALLAQAMPVVDDDDPLAGLEALLAAPQPDGDDALAGLDALLAAPVAAARKEDALTDLDDILAAPKPKARPVSGFGRIAAPAPSPERLYRPKFRMAILGDFTGRAARGEIAIGDAMARRRPILLDVDTVEDVIEGLATTLVLPIGPEGRGIAVPLKGLDSLHPDELVENVEVFEALKGLRQRLSTPSMAARAVAEMQGWGSTHTRVVLPTASRSAASAVPADLRLSDFQRLIGDREGRLTTPSPVADLIGQIVGPYVVPGPNPEAKALRGAVDEAMSHAMRLILHHPEFQAIEAQWRSLDLLARRIETDEKLELVLFDISAEEIAADMTAGEDLSKSGLFRLLNAPLQDEGAIGFSAMFGLYAFQETPPHAALLGRVGAIAAHLQMPFFTSVAANFLDTAKKDRHPLVAKAWDALRRDPAAAWLGLASPRFLLRRPYGASSEPVDAFDFEEFTMAEGLSGMLWANPVVLAAVLLAEAWSKGRGKVVLGKQMSMGDMPYHIVEDEHGDQVALPCTERNMTTEKTEVAVTRGLMPVVSIRGRDVVRLASFQSVAGTEIAGPWLDEPPVRLPDGEGATIRAQVPAAGEAAAQSMEDELDALLAGFGDSPAPVDPGAIDADLAALLEGL